MPSVTYLSEITRVLQLPEFQKLREIGGHKVYHLEGDAYTHTMLVMLHAIESFGIESLMVLVALLHDVGKIYISVCNGPGDWSYPNHARAGAENLDKFLPISHPEFSKVQWYIANHIKPLFWRGKDLGEAIANMNVPEGCSIVALAELAICDVKGSKSVEPQSELLNFLQDFVSSRKEAMTLAAKYGLQNEVLTQLNRGDSPTEALREWDLL
jgi:hypothetical protein